jgi:lipopolysaccharide export system permease protein
LPVHLAKTLSAYIARQFLAWFAAVFATLAIIAFLGDYVELIRRSGDKAQATLWGLLELAALKQPHLAQQILPFAVLFGTMLVFWRLTRSNELVVARAAGVSVWQFLTPAALVALIIGILAVTVFNPIAAALEADYQRLEARVLQQGSDPLLLSNAGLWLRQSDQAGNQVIMHAAGLGGPGMNLDRVTVYFFNDLVEFTSRIDAKSARLGKGAWQIADGVRWLPDEPAQPFAELRLPTRLTASKIEESFASPDTMSFWDLPGFIRLLEQSGFSALRHRLHFDILLARPFLLCAMVLVAATFSLRMQRRGGATLMIVGGVVCGFLLYFLSDIIYALGLAAKIPVMLAAWTPTGVSMIFGVSMLLHLEDG